MKGSKKEVRPGVWRLRVYLGRNHNGHPQHASRTFHGGSRAADTELRHMIDQVLRSRTPDRSATLARLLEEWMANRQATPATLAGDQGYIDKRIAPRLGHIRLDRLTARDLDRAYRAWEAEPLKPATVRKMHAIISSALHQAVRWGWVDQAVSKKARAPVPDGKLDRYITPNHLVALIRRAETHDPPMVPAIWLGAVTGARRGELCSLHWSDITDHTLTISRSTTALKGGELRQGPTKTHQDRKLVLADATLTMVHWWQNYQQEFADWAAVPLAKDPHLITLEPRAHKPMRPDTLSHRFAKLSRDLGLPYHLHELRHFSATQMIAGGIDPELAASRLGHADSHITLRIYTHATEEADKRAAQLLDRLMPALAERSDT